MPLDFEQQIKAIQDSALEEITGAADEQALEQVRVRHLGKKSPIAALLKGLGKLPAADRPRCGGQINTLKSALQQEISVRKAALFDITQQQKIAAEKVDVSLPARNRAPGGLHPITATITVIEDLFIQAGFVVEEGYEIESNFHNFDALNIPASHPARAMHDTFYLSEDRLLRTHTSPVQVRVMESGKPPFRVIAPGRVYRCDSDLTHTPMFHQIEGFIVDKGVTFAALKSLLIDFLQQLFEREVETRFRPSYFPFTEPSAEVDISCVMCDGKGCRVCGDSGWLEVLGCGMIHPDILTRVGLDPEEYTGLAFGMGIERLAMLLHGINDIRLFFDNDVRFLQQFSGQGGR